MQITRKIMVTTLLGIVAWMQAAPGMAAPPEKGRDIIQPFNYEGVRLLPGRLKDQFDQVTRLYLSLRPNDLLKGFRVRAGKHAPGKELGGAYSQNALSFGQWLGGFARLYKVTGDEAVRDKAAYLMDEWGKTIDEDGYFGYRENAVGHYVYDKFVGGLVDMYEFTGNPNALKYLERITDWAEKHLDRSNEYALPTEWYTLAENLYRAYELTGDERYRQFGKVWEYHDFWNALARKEDLFHALHRAVKHRSYHGYSHVNTLSSAAMAYRVTGERHYLDTIVNGYEWLRDTQLFATGGYAPEEQFIVPEGMPEVLVGIRRGESNVDIRFHFETSCGSWAGFKLSRYLMRFTGEARYGDWMERLIYNGVGAMVPMNDYGMIMYGSCYHIYGARKSLSTVWFCCQGSLLQTVTDYHNLIYFHDDHSLYVNLFVPSQVEWHGPQGPVTLVQETRFPEEATTRLKLKLRKPGRFALKFRVPLWATQGIDVAVNKQPVKLATVPGQWAVLERNWQDGDLVTLRFDLSIRAEPCPGCISPVAVLCGPVVMVMSTVRDSEGGVPFEGPLKFPGDWLEVHDRARLNPARQLHTNRELRPFYEMRTGEFYTMYFERWGRKAVPQEQLVFKGDWDWNGHVRSCAEPGSSVEAEFRGSVLVWEGLRQEDAGIASVSIDGRHVADVDQYACTDVHVGRLDQREVPFRWFKTGLGGGRHTVRVTVTGRKNPLSKGTRINVSGLAAYP